MSFPRLAFAVLCIGLLAPQARADEIDVKAMMRQGCTNGEIKTKFLDLVEKSRGKEERAIVLFELDEECDLLKQDSPEKAVNETADPAPEASHSDWTTAARYSPDGKTILSASKDGTVRLWDVETGKPISRVELPLAKNESTSEQLTAPWIRSVVFIGDGKYFAVASNAGPVRVYETATGQKFSEIQVKMRYGLAPHLATSKSGLLLVGQDDGRSAAGDPIAHVVRYQPPSARAVAISDQAGLFAIGTEGADIGIGKLDNGDLVAEFKGKTRDRPNAIAFSKDGARFAVAFGETVVVYETATRKELQTVKVHPLYSAFDVAFTADGKGLITCRSHPVLWDIASGRIVRRFGPFRDLCHSIDVSPDGKYMATTSMGHDVRIWEIETGKFFRRLGTYVPQQ